MGMTGRRGFLATLAGGLLGHRLATTTLSAAPADACTTIDLAAPIDPSAPFLFVDDTLSLDQFSERYLKPVLDKMVIEWQRDFNRMLSMQMEQIRLGPPYRRGRNLRSEPREWIRMRFDPQRLPA